MGGCYIWYSEEGPGWAAAPPSPLLAVPNITAHPSTASVQTSYYSMCTVITSAPVHTGDKVEFNMVDFVESRLYVAVYVQLCCRFWQQLGNNVNSTACRGRLCCRYGRLCCPLYGAKARQSTTFNKVDRVEFNFVSSVYRALRVSC